MHPFLKVLIKHNQELKARFSMTKSSEDEIFLASQNAVPNYSLWQMVQYALKLGSIGFGGPIALVGYMHRDLVEDRKWISESEYSEGMTDRKSVV